jgi:hypothetical protein
VVATGSCSATGLRTGYNPGSCVLTHHPDAVFVFSDSLALPF